MSENEKNTISGELISEEQLDAVTGGKGGVSDPWRSAYCWFKSDIAMREDGRIWCVTECKGMLDSKNKPILYQHATREEDKNNWHICCCWGTDNCVDRWHKPCGHTSRW